MKIGERIIGEHTFIIAEIGINHNGDIDIAKKLIDVAVEAGCDAVKFQKRTVNKVYTKHELDRPRESPWGTTNREQKLGLEFGENEYDEIAEYCDEKETMWFASCWDKKSVDFIAQYNPPCYKIPSALLTDYDLLEYIMTKEKPVILSTGMSTAEEVERAVKILEKGDLIILHCTSTYPSKPEELNLRCIQSLQETYPNIPIGYSGHEVGLSPSLVAASLGACVIERHITLDRAMYGSDQASSIESQGLKRLVRDIRSLPVILGDGTKKVYDSEIPIMKKLRRK